MRALLSVADRKGLAEFARSLLGLGVELFATEGTRESLAADGIEVRPIEDLTGTPSLAGGQVRTFHPQIYAGILARRDRPEQMAELTEHGLAPIDLVIVNVRPFAPQVGSQIVGLHEAVEMIDVGGLALLSAAARNFAGVAAVCSAEYYGPVLADLRER
ncbi:MAG TPA: bifunctional phosphoribosylaminoimidazolecarboxamide formyltransferase/IMP cyclohydrolase, partial [Candidatus Limnocylindrales bacterium]|nr:bifunctional phosphoribosylaminoimidazolecarboxamide formyltransferase/IMP cyclohydrolase [Candidatus Limnocylindrales bacterium]